MLHKLVTRETLEEGRVEGGGTRFTNGPAFCVSVIGACMFTSSIYFLFNSERENVHIHLATDEANEHIVEIACDANPEHIPVQGLIHMNNCQLASTDGVTARFPGFEDILPAGTENQTYAWTKFRIQHNTPNRRRSYGKTWEDVLTDGNLSTQWRVAPSVNLGPYKMTAQDVIRKVPGTGVLLREPAWQQQGLPPPIVNSHMHGGSWVLNTSAMSYGADCNCLWAGDTRIFIDVANANTSFVGGALPGPKVGNWIHDNGQKVSVLAAGASPAEHMLEDRLHRKDKSLWLQRLFNGVVLSFGLWCMIWPIIALICCVNTSITITKGVIAESLCGPCMADVVMYEDTVSSNNAYDSWRCCSTWSRAMALGICLTALFCFTGWIGFRFNVYIALVIGFGACAIEFGYRHCMARHDYEALSEIETDGSLKNAM